jgi:hypothetical protein
MKKSIALMSLMLAGSSAWAAVVTTNFNQQADTGYIDNTALIGADWKQNISLNKWRVQGGKLWANPLNGRPAIFYNTRAETISGNGTNFNYSVSLIPRTNLWAGAVFGYQNETNYYVLRIQSGSKNYELLSVVHGSTNTLQAGTASVDFIANSSYTFTITSDTAYEFDFTIKEDSLFVPMGSGTGVVDAGANFNNGYAGVYVDLQTSGAPAKFDDFKLKVKP